MSGTSTPTAPHAAETAPRRPRRRLPLRIVGWVGWVLLGLALLVMLYLVYSLWFTNVGTQRAQADLRDDFAARVEQRVAAPAADPRPLPAPEAAPTPEPSEATEATDASEPPDDPALAEDPALAAVPQDGDGSAVALLWFERPGAPDPVTDEPYVVVDGVALADLARGPGHYPDSDDPGEGNFAVAGHRTTHGAPFFRLDDLQDGDEIHVLDLDGTEHVYRYVSQRVVAPTEVWVVGGDPLGLDAPTITLTTCHPRFSNRQRLVAFGELVS